MHHPFILFTPQHPFLLPSPTHIFLSHYHHHFNKNMCYLAFWAWLISLSMISSSIHFPANDIISFFFMAKILCCVSVCSCVYSFLYPVIGCSAPQWFHNLTIVKRSAINIGIQITLLDIALCSFVYIKSGMVGSLGIFEEPPYWFP
jgi:hypothetical protein